MQFLPRAPNYFDEHSHSGPWAYLQRVPLLLYGPRHVHAVGRVDRSVTLADLAPTLAPHLRFPFPRRDARPLWEAAVPGADPPRLIVTIVWDGGGRNVLREHPDAWPTLRRLRSRGAWFGGATVASSPSVSPSIHATLGTGLAPADHGLVDMVFRDGVRMTRVQHDPRYLLAPTLADVYDRRRANRPVVALVGHPLVLAMLGHGSACPGGDRDLALVEAESGWVRPAGGARYFRFPRYAGDPAELRAALEVLDRRDGRPDGAWRGEALSELEPRITPAFASFQTGTIGELIRHEGMGSDRVPDLLFVNYNQINEVGHHWSMNSIQMADTVRSNDRALRDLVRLLNSEVGRGEWLLALTADHGSTPDRSVSGAFVIDSEELGRDLGNAFDRDWDRTSAVAALRVTQLWLDQEELRDGGFTAEDVASFLREYTQGENRANALALAPAEREVPLFAAAFRSRLLRVHCAAPAGT